MVKHTQPIRRLLLTNCLSVFDHFVELALKELKNESKSRIKAPEQHRLTLITCFNMNPELIQELDLSLVNVTISYPVKMFGFLVFSGGIKGNKGQK